LFRADRWEARFDAQLGYRWDQLRIYGTVSNVFDSGEAATIQARC